jgi:ferric-dicitrate binding protein FerR (iron transport regulator)
MLGTRFDVRSDKDGRKSKITLVSGEIKVLNGNGQWKLHPGERAIIEGGKIRIRTIEHPERDLLWHAKGPKLEFDDDDDEKADEVIRQLAGAYHVKVFNPDHLQGIPITGVFLLKDPLDTNLVLIRRIEDYHVRVERRNDTIFLLKPKP